MTPDQNLRSPWYRFAEAAVTVPTDNDVETKLQEALQTLASPAPVVAEPDAPPEVSVIITAFNCGPHLQASVDSLLRQTLLDVEIIIVDDCSRDDTFLTARQLQSRHARVRALRTATNGGTYVAKNLGLLEARGRFVTFQDSDDISHPDRLARQLEPLRRDPELVATTCHYCRIDEDLGTVILNRGVKSRPGLISLMFERQRVLQTIGYFDCVRVNADDEFKTRLKRAFGARALFEFEACWYFALLRSDGLTVAGHTANNLAGSNLKTFLAPVRQRYTRSFLDWHKASTADAQLFVEFPGTARPFPAPRSIDPVAHRRAASCTLHLINDTPEAASAALAAADPALWRTVTTVAISAPSFKDLDNPQAALERALGEPRTLPMRWLAVPWESTVDRQFKEVADLAGGGLLLLARSAADVHTLPADELRRAIYALYQAATPTTLVALCQGRLLLLNLDTVPIASLRIPKTETSLIRGVLRQALSTGAALEFAGGDSRD